MSRTRLGREKNLIIAAAHSALDDDEHQALLCPICRDNPDGDGRCVNCGAPLGTTNTTFNLEHFRKLSLAPSKQGGDTA